MTSELKDPTTGHQRATASASETADWSFPTLLPKDAQGRLVSVTMTRDDDERFTGEHLAITSTFEAPESDVAVQHVVWAYWFF